MPRDLFEENGIDLLEEGGVDLLADEQVNIEKPQKGFLARTGENLGKAWEEATTPIVSRGEFVDKVPGLPIIEKAAAIAAPIGRTVADAAITGAKGIYELGVSPQTRQSVSDVIDYIGDSDIVKSQIKTLKGAYETANAVAPRGMEFAGNLTEAANIIPAAGLAKAAIPALPKMAAKTLDDVVEYGFKKGIKPSVEGKSDAGLTAKFYDNAKTAVKEQVERYPDAIPENVEQFSKNIRQAKKDIWSEATAMAEAAGDKGATTSIVPLRSEMEAVVTAKNVPKSAKDAAQKVLNEIADYTDEITPVQAEELIAHFNSRSTPFWNDPNPNKLDDALFNKRAASNLRKTTDKAIESYEGPGWEDLRKRYGAQTAIEKAVSNRANVAARQNVKGFFDLTDVFSTGEFIAGIASMSPSLMAKAIAMRGAKAYIKSQNDVNNIVRKMFKDTKKIIDAEKKGRAAVRETVLPSFPVPDEIPMQPSRLSPNDIDAMIAEYADWKKTSRTPFSPELAAQIKQLRDVPALPPGQGFEVVGEPFLSDMLPVVSEARGAGFTSVPKSKTSSISPMDTTREALTPDIGWGPTKYGVSDLNYKTRNDINRLMTMREALRIFRESQEKFKK